DGVSDELLDRSSVPLQDGLHLSEVGVQHLAEGLRVQLLAEAGRSFQVREDDRDGLADLLRRGLRREALPTVAAQTEPVGVLLTAVGTDLHAWSLRGGPDRYLRSFGGGPPPRL